MLLFKDKMTFLGLDYRDASLITSYLFVIGISIQKSDEFDNYRVAALSKLYLTIKGIIMQSLKSIGQF